MDYGTFKIRAVVDFIELEVTTSETHHYRDVRASFGINRFDRPYAEPIGPDYPEGKEISNMFKVRLYDVERSKDLMTTVNGAGYKLNAKTKIVAVEIAIDFYNAPSGLVSHLFKNVKLCSNNTRIYHRNKGSPKAVPNDLDLYIKNGWQIGIGNTNDKVYQHAYYKTHDRNELLPNARHRPRFETRLSDDCLPYQTLEDWQSAKFGKLAKHFRFTKPKENITSEDETRILARELMIEYDRNPRKRKTDPRREADSLLNRRVENALRQLSDRWTSERKKGAPCKKLGGIIPSSPYER